MLKRFLFWLPFFSLCIIIFEIIAKPIKHVWMAFDPIFSFLFSLMPDDFQSSPIAMTLHFILAVAYGFVLDYFRGKHGKYMVEQKSESG